MLNGVGCGAGRRAPVPAAFLLIRDPRCLGGGSQGILGLTPWTGSDSQCYWCVAAPLEEPLERDETRMTPVMVCWDCGAANHRDDPKCWRCGRPDWRAHPVSASAVT